MTRVVTQPGESIIPFAKYHGLGNDFVVVADSSLNRTRGHDRAVVRLSGAAKSYLARLSRSICHRNTGVGADGLLVLLAPKEKGNDARMRVFNADGSEAEMSGNGIRCAAAHLASRRDGAHTLSIETAAGLRSLQLISGNRLRAREDTNRWTFRVNMGVPRLDPAEIPFRAPDARAPVVSFPLAIRKRVMRVTVTSMGNPHCSLFVQAFDSVDWEQLGTEIEHYEFFPNRTNVEFIRVLSRHEIEVRYWERGVGKTASSGTGSCAAVVASVLNGRTDRKVRVRTLAGTLEVAWPEDQEVTLTGPAELVAEGIYHFRTGKAARSR